MELHNRHIILGLALALVVVATVGVLAWNHSGSQAAGASPELHLNASGTGVTCQGSAPNTQCTAANLNATITMKILGACCNPGSAGGFQSELYGVSDLGYVPGACASEVTMMPQTICLGPTVGVGGQVSHGNSTGLLPPLAAWANPPNLASISLTCGGEEGVHEVVLTAYDDALNPLGSYFGDTNGNNVYVKENGTAMLDTDGPGGSGPVSVPIADKITIQCGTPPPPTDTPTTPTATNTPCPGECPTATNTLAATATNTRTPTRTPTNTPTESPIDCGDVNGSGETDSIDAALILQHNAGLLPTLMHPQVGDLNDDGNIDSLDALLVLQFNGGLIDSLNC